MLGIQGMLLVPRAAWRHWSRAGEGRRAQRNGGLLSAGMPIHPEEARSVNIGRDTTRHGRSHRSNWGPDEMNKRRVFRRLEARTLGCVKVRGVDGEEVDVWVVEVVKSA
jgi:hypothetical protein